MAFFFCKNPQMWPKGPIQIVVWVAEGIRGYEVVSKHSKRVATLADFLLFRSLARKEKIACWDIPNPYEKRRYPLWQTGNGPSFFAAR